MPGRTLPEHAIQRLIAHAVPEQELTQMRVVTGVPGRWLPLLLRASAVTLGHHVFVRAGRYDVDSVRGLALLAHEAGHISQWHDLGVRRFLFQYGRGLLTSRFSHARHPLERPLNERQRLVRAALDDDDGAVV